MNEVQEQSLTGRTTWLLFARTLSFAFIFALPLLLVRRFSQHEFGVYKQVFLFVATASATLPVGFGMSAFYFLPRKQVRPEQIVFNIVIFHMIVGILASLVLLLYPTLLATIFNSPELAEYAPMVGLVALLWIVSSLLEIVVIANQEAKLASILIVVSQFSKAALLLAAAISFGSVRALIYGALIQGVLQTAILLHYLRSRFGNFWHGFNWSVMRMQLAYALPFGIAALLFRMHSDLHNYFVSYQFGAAAFAIYSVGCFNILLVDMLAEAVGSVMIPRVSYLQSLAMHREIIDLVARMMRKLAAALFPLFIFLLITSREIITILFTTQYIGSWPIFAINLMMIPLTLVSTAYDPVIRAYAEHRYFLMKVRAVLVLVLLIALWLATKYLGLVGAIGAVVSVSFLERIAIGIKTARILQVTRRDISLFKDVGKLAIASIAAGLITVFVRSLLSGGRPIVILAVCGIIFPVIYLATILMLDILTLEDREFIRRSLVLRAWRKAEGSLS